MVRKEPCQRVFQSFHITLLYLYQVDSSKHFSKQDLQRVLLMTGTLQI